MRRRLLFLLVPFCFSGCVERTSVILTHGNAGLAVDPHEMPGLVKAAEAGDATAAFRLSLYFESAPNQRSEVVRYLRIATKAGHPLARYNLGAILIDSENPTERDEGIRLLRAAAEDVEEARMLLKLRGIASREDGT